MGLGCTITDWHGMKRITHNGGYIGFRTMHVQVPEKDFDVILLSNSGWGEGRYHIIEAVYDSYYGNNDAPGEKVNMDMGYI